MVADNALLRQLPSIDTLLQSDALIDLQARAGRSLVLGGCRAVLEEARLQIAVQGTLPTALPARVVTWVEAQLAATLRPVINATGVIVHTNLGRAPLSAAARQAMEAVALGYSTLEFDLESGRRGSRYDHVSQRLAAVTGAEAGLVVNNNAAALVLTLAALAQHREVLISRAHLVEIGGGFRIPDIMVQSGAQLREVGTTNRTYVRDFVSATTEQSALWLRVHASNFRIDGFVHQPNLHELVAAAAERGVGVVDDVGSGALLDTTRFGLAKEPMVQESIAAGVSLVLFSGDKLLGGPQAGCIVGERGLIERLRRHPLARALRVDKTTLAALDATLQAYQRGRAEEEIPIWQMIGADDEDLRQRATKWQEALRELGVDSTVQRGLSAVGGGSLPGETLPTWLLAVEEAAPTESAHALRRQPLPLIVRIADDYLLLDPRTVLPKQDDEVIEAFRRQIREKNG